MDKKDNIKLQTHTASLLIMVASVDEKFEKSEEATIKKILADFFHINALEIENLIISSEKMIKESTDIYAIASLLNEEFTPEEKLELLYCIFEVAYSDESFHFMERHMINQIANILNVDRNRILTINKEMKNILL